MWALTEVKIAHDRPSTVSADQEVGRSSFMHAVLMCWCQVVYTVPQGLTYVADFVLGREQAGLIDAIDAASKGRWTSSSCGRKIANFGGSPSQSRVTEVK